MAWFRCCHVAVVEIWREKGDVDGSSVGDGLVDGSDDVVGDDDGLVVEEGVGAGGMDTNKGEERERLFREF